MANTYFEFKQFTVHQEQVALKVATDSCLFGGWIANEIQSWKDTPANILDIGTGTGLLMLMVAQKCNAAIDGVEIDEPSYLQAKENSKQSPWKERLTVLRGNVNIFQFTNQYHLIISNPPFYEGDLKSKAGNRNFAMHDEGLRLEQLLQLVDKNLTVNGRFAVLLPYHRSEKFIEDAIKIGFYLQLEMKVRQTVDHSYFRSMLLFGRIQTITITKELSIKNENNQYTNEFVGLLKDYYLYL
jgi:tRNA1Val (adenine37-N6)-methyltransferase